MRFSLSWLREFVDTQAPASELARRLTSVGLHVETILEQDGDTLLEIEVLSNRPDCMNVYGVARELAAATGAALCPYPGTVGEDGGEAASAATVSIDAPDLCGRYCARLVRNVKLGPSPDWLARRLTAIGLRPVNNVVDVTNYVLWELGHPIHAFDYDTLKGHAIIVRLAGKGETLVTLDGVNRPLTPEMLVIADAERPVALAGVMGGSSTMVTESTRSLLIESAHFDPVSVRRTSKRLGLTTDASYRFERGADREAAPVALNRVADLVRQLAGGTVCRGVIEERSTPPVTRRIHLRTSRASLLLGIPVRPGAVQRALTALEFKVEARQDDFEVEVPSHRQDIEREVDLIEEVGRSMGYEAVPERIPHIAGSGGINRAGHRRESALRRALLAAGCHEALTTSFSTASEDWGLRQRLDDADPAIEAITLTNPITEDQEILRTTLLPGLLRVVAHNLNRGRKDVRFFEIGHTFRRGPAPPPTHGERKHPPAGPVDEPLQLGLALTGNVRSRHWIESPREMTFYDVKGLIESVLGEIGLSVELSPLTGSEALEAGRAAFISSGGARVGRFGALNLEWRERFDIKQDLFVAELKLDALFSRPDRRTAYRQLPRYPAVSRDLSLVARKEQAYGELEKAILATAPDRIVRVSVLDRYDGENLPPGTVGLTINIVYQHPDRTLASEEVTGLQERILEDLTGQFGVRLRA